ncbi:hypothetical protein AU252_15725 [Pseudarthrobacter sulfonivorans]|uniref:Uncharacterized protein n=1 Tax=Pseudarthrobacter sulfonivorans TaxID=121292 RepID=A0A0U3RB68_9MICC|nr:hypothetical protein AU252_15725 [Pseudarthrobacter sulfonivorans]
MRRRRRARRTEREIQKLDALTGGLDPEGVSRKIAVIATVSGFGLLRASIRKVLNRAALH